MANNKRDDLYKNSVDYDYVKSMYVVLNRIKKYIDSEEFETELMNAIDQKLQEHATDIYIQIRFYLSDTTQGSEGNYICITIGNVRLFKKDLEEEYISNLIPDRVNKLNKIYDMISDRLNDLNLMRHYDLPIVDDNSLTIRIDIENK